ncbi:hypothetical protein RI103_39545 (plasmid) [Paraburkholderia sp. FT54]|uniref:hypothetical protein n=1 Tax=Paraburkholderia sp. FT54 TaxID=3074437 RepID=UPI0028778ABC|nr:hypothetical protein [Paraburkholderia sp. FT54]WNC95555.1 hypothetical protein RI103_39545 [Paraburkholderia sp. FT54]
MVSGRRIVLMLDAWEKSPSLRSELATLESYLQHPEQWPHTNEANRGLIHAKSFVRKHTTSMLLDPQPNK